VPHHPPLCSHVQPGSWPFEIALVIDEQVGFTDALVTCRTCGDAYLLEMLDWQDRLRVMRTSTVERARVAGLLRDLARGSCDIRRAGAELQHVQTSSSFTPWLLVIDAVAVRIVAIVPVPATTHLPAVSWRALPCDGSWLAYARSLDQTDPPPDHATVA